MDHLQEMFREMLAADQAREQLQALDAAERQAEAGSTVSTYDGAGRLIRTDPGSGPATVYGYDGESKRVLVQPEGGPATRTTWDATFPLPQAVLETTGSDVTSHVYGVGRISSSGPGGSRYYHGDDRGSVTDTTDAQGVATFRASYDGFGRTTSSEVLRPGSSVPAFGYVGQQRDGDGTYHLRARQYDADLGRFTAQDPAGALAGDPYVTSYGYGLLRPTLYVDASGLCVFCLETVRGFSGALGDVAGATAAFGFGVGAVASGATLLCPVCAPVTGTVAAVSFGVAGVASATALATGAINSSIDCYQSANGYAPVVDGASCAGSLVDTALNYGFGRGARYLNDAAWFRRGPFAGPLRDSGRATRRNVGGAVNGSVEVAGYGFGRGIQRLFK